MKNKNLSSFKQILIASLVIHFFGIPFSVAQLDVPKDELATETVYPIFDHAKSVRNRNVQTEGRFDLGLFAGLALTEPIANSSKIGIAVNYHFNEYHSLGLFFVSNSSGLSKDAEGLKSDFGLDYSRAPQPKSTIMLDYNYKPYYGKMSFTKTGVINTSIYGSGSFGAIQYQHKTFPALAVGIGERFYFGKKFSLKTDLRLFVHQAPIPFKGGVLCDGSKASCGSNVSGLDPVPDYSVFDERITYTTNLEIGLNYLF